MVPMASEDNEGVGGDDVDFRIITGILQQVEMGYEIALNELSHH